MSKIIRMFKPSNKDSALTKNSRYKSLYRILEDNDEQYLETYDHFNVPVNSDDTYHVVKASDQNRLDIISYNYYGTSLLWWIIAEASGITDPFNIPVNTVLRVPSISSLLATNKGYYLF